MRTCTLSRLIRFGLNIYGVWPYVPTAVLFRLYWIAALSTAQVFQYRYVLVNIHTDDVPELMDGVGSAMTSSLFFIKLVILWINQKKFFNLLQMMAVDWRDSTSSHHSERVMTDTTNLARRTSRWIVGVQVVSVISYSAGVLAANAGAPEKLEPYARELILKMDFPFEISTDSIYLAITIIQFYHLFLVGYGITVVNSLLATLILHVGGQVDILREWLIETFSKDATHSTNKITIKSLIKKHQQIIFFSEQIENLYTYIAMMMLLSDTLITCCLGFIIATSIGSPNAAAILIKCVMFYLSMNLEAFIYCFSGEYLSAKSKAVGDAAYESLWYNTSAKETRIILILILRSQKRLTITGGRIADLSLELFTSVLKASASYISVLLAMY